MGWRTPLPPPLLATGTLTLLGRLLVFLQPQLDDACRALQDMRRVLHRTTLQPEVVDRQQLVARLDRPRAVRHRPRLDVRDDERVAAASVLGCCSRQDTIGTDTQTYKLYANLLG